MPSFKLQVCAVRLINPLKSMQPIKAWKGWLFDVIVVNLFQLSSPLQACNSAQVVALAAPYTNSNFKD